MPKANPSPLERVGQRGIPQVRPGGQFQPPMPVNTGWMNAPQQAAFQQPNFPGQGAPQGMPFQGGQMPWQNVTMPQQWPPAPIQAAPRPPIQQPMPMQAPQPVRPQENDWRAEALRRSRER